MPTSTHFSPAKGRFAANMAGVILPVFIFAGVLTSLLAFSIFYLLPLFMRVEVNGVARDVRALQTYHADLAASVALLEEERNRAVLALADPAFEALLTARRAAPPFRELAEEIRRTARALSPVDDAVHIGAVTFSQRAVTVEGDVRRVGPRSLTLLAQFTQELGHLPFASSVKQPLFAREEDPVLGMHSPFRIDILLR